METESLDRLHGGSVLVKSGYERHDPPISLRGTLDTVTTPGMIKVVLDYPDMCAAPAHREVISLDARGVELLLASEREGVYEISIPPIA